SGSFLPFAVLLGMNRTKRTAPGSSSDSRISRWLRLAGTGGPLRRILQRRHAVWAEYTAATVLPEGAAYGFSAKSALSASALADYQKILAGVRFFAAFSSNGGHEQLCSAKVG